MLEGVTSAVYFPTLLREFVLGGASSRNSVSAQTDRIGARRVFCRVLFPMSLPGWSAVVSRV